MDMWRWKVEQGGRCGDIGFCMTSLETSIVWNISIRGKALLLKKSKYRGAEFQTFDISLGGRILCAQ